LRRPRTKGGSGVPKLSELETQRADVTRESYARIAEKDPVTHYARELVGGEVLSDKEVDALLASPAPAFLSPHDFDRLGIPCSSHSSEVVQDLDVALPDDVWLRIVTLRLHFKNMSVVEVVRYPLPDRPRRPNLPRLIVHQGFEHEGSIEVLPGSMFDELRKVSEQLTWKFRWFPEEALRFLLTGAVPRTPPVHVEIMQHRSAVTNARITLVVDPWVSDKTIARVYRRTQQWTYGQHHRQTVTAEKLELFRFVRKRVEAMIGFASRNSINWLQIYRAWCTNRRISKRVQGYKNFARDYYRVAESLMNPSYMMGRSARLDRERRRLLRALHASTDSRERNRLAHSLDKLRNPPGPLF